MVLLYIKMSIAAHREYRSFILRTSEACMGTEKYREYRKMLLLRRVAVGTHQKDQQLSIENRVENRWADVGVGGKVKVKV